MLLLNKEDLHYCMQECFPSNFKLGKCWIKKSSCIFFPPVLIQVNEREHSFREKENVKKILGGGEKYSVVAVI